MNRLEYAAYQGEKLGREHTFHKNVLGEPYRKMDRWQAFCHFAGQLAVSDIDSMTKKETNMCNAFADRYILAYG